MIESKTVGEVINELVLSPYSREYFQLCKEAVEYDLQQQYLESVEMGYRLRDSYITESGATSDPNFFCTDMSFFEATDYESYLEAKKNEKDDDEGETEVEGLGIFSKLKKWIVQAWNWIINFFKKLFFGIVKIKITIEKAVELVKKSIQDPPTIGGEKFKWTDDTFKEQAIGIGRHIREIGVGQDGMVEYWANYPITAKKTINLSGPGLKDCKEKTKKAIQHLLMFVDPDNKEFGFDNAPVGTSGCSKSTKIHDHKDFLKKMNAVYDAQRVGGFGGLKGKIKAVTDQENKFPKGVVYIPTNKEEVDKLIKALTEFGGNSDEEIANKFSSKGKVKDMKGKKQEQMMKVMTDNASKLRKVCGDVIKEYTDLKQDYDAATETIKDMGRYMKMKTKAV